MNAAAAASNSAPTSEELVQPFSADVSRLLGIVANALYSHQDVFLRELISNASDACDRLRYESVLTPELAAQNHAFCIRILRDPNSRTLTVIDNGIGMNRDELIDHLGTIAKSGTARLIETIKSAKDSTAVPEMIGQFGVGFYACFMVADRVSVISRRAGTNESWVWDSDGATGFSTRVATEEEAATLNAPHGTAVILFLKPDEGNFLVDEALRTILQRYSDHINIPIYLGQAKADEQPVNAVTALWLRSGKDVSEQDYLDFYRHITTGLDTPLLTAHWKAEGATEFSALLYVPELRPWDLFDPARKHAVKLYVRRVFITDQCDGLIYPWLRFLRGVIDCADLPLNISRETLQANPVLEKIRRAVARRLLNDLDRLATEKPDAFATFWGQFGPVIKEGLYDAHALRPEIFKVCRFRSTHDNGASLVSLSDYLSRMKPDQKAIYTIAGPNIDALLYSPQIEGFRARGIEVLLFTDTIDDFWIQIVTDYEGKPFRPVTKGVFDLGPKGQDSEAQKDEEGTEPETIDSKGPLPYDSPGTASLVERMNAVLSGQVGLVRASQRLTDSPVCLVAAENEVDLHLERVLRTHQHYDAKNKRVLEINAAHPLLRHMAEMADAPEEARLFSDLSFLLLDQARIAEGDPLPDPSAYARRLTSLILRGLASPAQ